METEFETRSVTIGDIASTLGITKATVSYALNGKGRVAPATRQTVLDTARQMGFRYNPHAQRLKTGRCNDTIALFVLNFDLGVTTRKLQLLQRAMTVRGYRCPVHVCGTEGLLVSQEQSYQAEAMNNLRMQKPLGIICNIVNLDSEALRELDIYRREGGFVVCYDHKIDLDCDQVIFDREENTYCATRFLLEKGHRNIGLYGGWGGPNVQRFAGFVRALEEFDAPLRQEWILRGRDTGTSHEDHGGYSEEIGKRLVQPFMALRQRPSAICFTDDAIAAAFVAESLRRGMGVPEEISVMGHDDLPLASAISAVPLSTVSQPLEEIAEAVIEMMMDRINGTWIGEARQRVLHGHLVERESVTAL